MMLRIVKYSLAFLLERSMAAWSNQCIHSSHVDGNTTRLHLVVLVDHGGDRELTLSNKQIQHPFAL